MTTHHRLLATTMLTSLALLAPAAPVLAADLVIDNGEPATITTPGNSFGEVGVGVSNPGQSLTVSGDGGVTSADMIIGLSTASDNNSVTVTGGNASWDANGGIFVGWNGSGNSLEILNGADVTAGALTISFLGSSSDNALRVAGDGSRLMVGDGLMIGQSNGGNDLRIEDGGVAVSGWGAVGWQDGADNNSVTVTGAGSAWEIGENPAIDFQLLYVGGIGSGNTLMISDGGRVEAFDSLIAGGAAGASDNAITVTGEGSRLLVREGLVLGYGADDNSLTVRDGGRLETSLFAHIGEMDFNGAAANGNHVDVTGEGSSWSLSGDLLIGAQDGATATAISEYQSAMSSGNYVLVENGAIVTQAEGSTFVGSLLMPKGGPAPGNGEAAPVNSLIVRGAGSSFSTDGDILVTGNGALEAGEGASITAGGLFMAEGASLGVYVSDSAASVISVVGNAELDGTLSATIGGGGLASNRYSVLTAAETRGDFDAFAVEGNPDFLSVHYEVTLTSVDLVFASDFTGLTGLNENQRNTAGAIDRFFNGGGELGGGFSGLFGLSEQDLPRALSEISGEVGATGGAQAAEQANTSFLNLMTRTRMHPSTGSQTAAARVGDVTVQPAADTPAQGGGWAMWGAVFGGTAELPEDSSKGSHDTDTSAIGIATGWDHALSADTALGFALAGGATDWDLGGAMGSGDSTFLQLGANASHRMGASYLSLAGAYAWHAMSTERHVTLPVSEKLESDFNTNALAGRIEGGHRFGGNSTLGLTPYAALQAQAIFLPEYDEDGTLGADSFALSYDSQTATAVRGELGLGLDAALGGGRLWGRAAWAHDWNSEGNVDAAFQSLPGASFTVNGAESPEDIALVSLGAELGVTDSGMLSASFDGEFGEDYESYSGTLSLGFRW